MVWRDCVLHAFSNTDTDRRSIISVPNILLNNRSFHQRSGCFIFWKKINKKMAGNPTIHLTHYLSKQFCMQCDRSISKLNAQFLNVMAQYQLIDISTDHRTALHKIYIAISNGFAIAFFNSLCALKFCFKFMQYHFR